MVECKCVINDGKTGKSYQKQVQVDDFVGKKIGEKLSGAIIGLLGYELEITGGSDVAGFPMKKEIMGAGRKKMMLKKGDTGANIPTKGMMLRKTIVGNTVGTNTAQINVKIIKQGTKSVEELIGVPPKEGEAPKAT